MKKKKIFFHSLILFTIIMLLEPGNGIILNSFAAIALSTIAEFIEDANKSEL